MQKQEDLLRHVVMVLNCHSTKSRIDFSFHLTLCQSDAPHDYNFVFNNQKDGKTLFEFSNSTSDVIFGGELDNLNQTDTWDRYKSTIEKYSRKIIESIRIKHIDFPSITQNGLDECLSTIKGPDIPEVEITAYPLESIKKWWNNLTPVWQQAFNAAIRKIVNDPEASLPKENLMVELFKVNSIRNKAFDFSNCKLTDLSGIQYLRPLNIIELNLSGNQLESVEELRNHTNIIKLFLNNNKLDPMDIESLLMDPKMQSLKVIWVRGNQIDDKQIERLDSMNDVHVRVK